MKFMARSAAGHEGGGKSPMFFKRKRRLEARITALERMETVKSWHYGEIGLLDLVRVVERLEKELEMLKKIKAASGN